MIIKDDNSQFSTISQKKISTILNNDIQIIEDVPYVNQETKLFCAYACPTMIFQYYKINTNLYEVLYFSGIGYSLMYSVPSFKFFPISSFLLSQTSHDRKFLAKLYGLSYKFWQPEINVLSDEKCWQEYWQNVKQYILNNIPVITQVNSFILPSKLNRYKISKYFMNFFSVVNVHSIVIVGFDEEKGIVYYYDPSSTLQGKSETSTYNCVDIKTFRNMVSTAKFGKIKPKYLIETFIKNGNPLSKEKAFESSHKRNIERMKGNPKFFARMYSKHELGMSALETFKNDFELKSKKYNDIIKTYKIKGKKLYFLSKLYYLYLKVQKLSSFKSDIISNIFEDIVIEKKYAIKYLEGQKYLTIEYKKEIQLLRKEVEIWSKIAYYYSKFIGINLLMRNSNAVDIIKNINLKICDIISIEKEIINES
jgi:hypothetical protein